MPRDYNINISVGGGDRRGAFSGGNLSKDSGTLNSKMYKNNDNGKSITSGNLKKVFSVGMLFNKSQQANELIGAYSGNRLRQKRIDVGMTFAKYGIGIAINPVLGGVYAVSDIAYRGISYGISTQKKNREADYFKRLSGNNALSGRRYSGG